MNRLDAVAVPPKKAPPRFDAALALRNAQAMRSMARDMLEAADEMRRANSALLRRATARSADGTVSSRASAVGPPAGAPDGAGRMTPE